MISGVRLTLRAVVHQFEFSIVNGPTSSLTLELFSIPIPPFLCIPWLFDRSATTEHTEDISKDGFGVKAHVEWTARGGCFSNVL
jgi:hypothetical protein